MSSQSALPTARFAKSKSLSKHAEMGVARYDPSQRPD